MRPALSSSSDRLPALDTLRAFAIIWVILHHLHDGFSLAIGSEPLRQFFLNGNAGVDLFFVLSGYLITTILLGELRRTNSLDVGRFWYRRWMRTLPAYFAVLIVLIAYDLAKGSGTWWNNFPSYFGFLQTYTNNEDTLRFAWSWSLCTEEWFYLLLPLLVIGLYRVAGRARPELVLRCIAGAVVLFSLASRIWLYHLLQTEAIGAGHYKWAIDLVIHYRLDGLAAGVFVATLPKPRASRGLAAAALAAIGLLTAWTLTPESHFLMVARPMLLALGFGTLVYASVGDNAWARLRIPGATIVADLAYSLYLTHPMVEKTVRQFAAGHGLPLEVQIGMFLVLTVVASLALRYGVELPFLRLRDRLRRRTQPTASPAPIAEPVRQAASAT